MGQDTWESPSCKAKPRRRKRGGLGAAGALGNSGLLLEQTMRGPERVRMGHCRDQAGRDGLRGKK